MANGKPGRPPKSPTTKTTTLTIKIPAQTKNMIIELADGYDMTITEYLTTLVNRDAEKTPTSTKPWPPLQHRHTNTRLAKKPTTRTLPKKRHNHQHLGSKPNKRITPSWRRPTTSTTSQKPDPNTPRPNTCLHVRRKTIKPLRQNRLPTCHWAITKFQIL